MAAGLGAAGLAVAAALAAVTVAGGAQATDRAVPAGAAYRGMHQVVVRPGQTLWSLATAAEPSADPRDVVRQIMSANALPSPAVVAGQVLWVPR